MRKELSSIDSYVGPTNDERRRPPREAHVLFLVALACVARVAMGLIDSPRFPGDGQVFDSYAIRIASGLGFGPSSSLPPLYPYFLGMLYRIYGYSQHTVILSQSLLGSLALFPAVVLAHLAGLDRKTVILAGSICALFPQAVAEARHLTPVLLLSSLASVGALTWLRRPGVPSTLESIAAGAIVGGSILGRTGLIIPMLLLIAARRLHEYSIAPGVGFHRVPLSEPLAAGTRLDLLMRRGFVLVAAFCIVAPWTVRSSSLHGRSVFVESTWGLRLRAANLPDVPVVKYSIPGSEARAPDNMVLTENRIAFQEFLGYAVTQPDRLARAWASRAARFFAFSPISDSGSADPWPYRTIWFRVLQAMVFGAMLSMTLGWLVLLRGAGGIERALAAMVLGFIAVGVVSGRMGDARLLSLPYLAVLSGRGVGALQLLGGVGRARRILFLSLLVAMWIHGLRAGGLV